MTPTIEVRYTCDACGLKDTKVNMPARSATEGIGIWMRETVQKKISQDHRNKSPKCTAKAMTLLKIPINPDGLIGSVIE